MSIRSGRGCSRPVSWSEILTSQSILATLDAYAQRFPAETVGLAELRALVEAAGDVTSRPVPPSASPAATQKPAAHITAGAILLRGAQILLLHHKFLEIWLMPGGHIDAEDASLRGAARRELLEEAGLTEGDIQPFDLWPDDLPLDIGRHAIPPRPERNEAAHVHWDIRFCFRTETSDISPQASEVTAWERHKASQAPDRVGPKLAELLSL